MDHRRRRLRARSLVLLALWTLVPLLAAEGITRALVPRFPSPPTEWGTPELPYKLSTLPTDGADILVLGTSVTDAGVDPAALDDLAVPSRPTFNGSLGAGTLPMIAWTAREFWLPDLDPELVILGVSSRDVNANDPRQSDRAAQFFGSTEVRAQTGTASITERIDRWLRTRSALWAHREHLRSWDALTGEALDPWGPELTSPNGQYLAFTDGRYTPTPEQFDFIRAGGLKEWELDEDKLQAIRDIVRDARSVGADVWLLDSPTASDWVHLHPNGGLDVMRYQQAISGLAAELAVPLIRPAPFPDESFADVIHLNQQGAQELSRLLGQCVRSFLACPTV